MRSPMVRCKTDSVSSWLKPKPCDGYVGQLATEDGTRRSLARVVHRDFEYEVAADGFLLCRHVVDPEQDKLWEYEFRVRD